MLLLCIFLEFFSVANGFYERFYAYPTNIKNTGNDEPHRVTSYFYLQQYNKTTRTLGAELNVSDPIGPLMVSFEKKIWINGVFVSTSADHFKGSACSKHSDFIYILRSFKPSHLFDEATCSFKKGNLVLSGVILDDIMHIQRRRAQLNRYSYLVNILEEGKDSVLFSYEEDITLENRMFHFYANGLYDKYDMELIEEENMRQKLRRN